jgi:hypothetical protein
MLEQPQVRPLGIDLRPMAIIHQQLSQQEEQQRLMTSSVLRLTLRVATSLQVHLPMIITVFCIELPSAQLLNSLMS